MRNSLEIKKFATLSSLCAILLFGLVSTNGYARKMFSSLEITKIQSTGDVKNQKNKQLQFKIVPKPGLVVNEDGPWSLDITTSEKSSLTLMKTKYSKKEMDLKLPGVVVSYEKSGTEVSSLDYKFLAFVCTKDKKKCYFDIHKGTYEVK